MDTKALHGDILPPASAGSDRVDGVLSRRVFAFIFDYIIILALLIPASILVALFGILTLGIGWMLFAVLFPLVALPYVAWTLGGRRQATPGMRAMGVRLERTDGGPVGGLLAIVHTVLFWAGNAILTPLVLLVTLFADRKRTLHDQLLGTVVVRDD